MTGGGLRFPKEPPPPGRDHGRYALVVALFLLIMLGICVAAELELLQ